MRSFSPRAQRRQWMVLGLVIGLISALPLYADAKSDLLELKLDATDIAKNVIRAQMSIPATSGPLELVYPKWIQGEHGPTGPVVDLVGLKFTAADKPIVWRRDDLDAFSFHMIAPEGVDAIDVELEFLMPSERASFSRSTSTTASLGIMNLNQLILHPAGKPIAEQTIQASIVVPEGWQIGTALPVANADGAKTEFAPVSVETLCDSPIICGKHYKQIAIGPETGTPHYLCMVADSPDSLVISEEVKSALDQLIGETQEIFGEPPYKSYRFLVSMSDHIGHYGMEHHESSDNRCPAGMFTDPLYRKTWHGWLLCHEFVHAWNGKYRRPAGMSLSDHQQPLRTNLLWVYEGLTHYYGFVLAGRSGFWKPEIARQNFARIAARATDQTGRQWRSLEDTATAAHYLYRQARPAGWYQRRGTDFYDEAAMVWLEADAIIREQTGGKKSLDDFCHEFYAGGNHTPRVEPYEYADVSATLNRVAPYDWDAFFEQRVLMPGAEPPVGGITRSGWRLSFQAEPTDYLASTEADTKKIDLSHTLGVILREDGTVEDLAPQLPAAQAGVIAGMKLIAVNGKRWTPELIHAAVAKPSETGEVDLLFERNDEMQAFNVLYKSGGKYPTLTRASDDTPDRLAEILAAKKE